MGGYLVSLELKLDVIPVEWRSHVVYELSCDARVQRFIIYTSRSTRPMAGLRAMNYMQ